MQESEVPLDVCEAIRIMKNRSAVERGGKGKREMALSPAVMGLLAEKIADAVKISLKTVQE